MISQDESSRDLAQDLVELIRAQGATGFKADTIIEVELEITLTSVDGSNYTTQTRSLYGVKDGRSWYIVSV